MNVKRQFGAAERKNEHDTQIQGADSATAARIVKQLKADYIKGVPRDTAAREHQKIV
jgi:hypothetical protein